MSAWTGTQCFLSDISLPAQLELSVLTAIRSYTVQCVWSALSLPCDKQREQLSPSARLGFPVFPGTLQMLSCWVIYTGKCIFFQVCAFACLSLSVQKQQSQISDSPKMYFRIPQQPSDGCSFQKTLLARILKHKSTSDVSTSVPLPTNPVKYLLQGKPCLKCTPLSAQAIHISSSPLCFLRGAADIVWP